MTILKTLAIVLTVAALAIPVFIYATSLGRPEVRACVALAKKTLPDIPTAWAMAECEQHWRTR
jgi:hypothetical protein